MARTFQVIASTPPGWVDPSVAIAASRAGGIGVLDLEYSRDMDAALRAIAKLSHYARGEAGIKLDSRASEFLNAIVSDLPERVKTVILTGDSPSLEQHVEAFHRLGCKVLLEATSIEQARMGEHMGVDGVIAKGHECGGQIGEETTFVLLQRFLSALSIPIWAHGGVGVHTVAACYVAGAAGVVLDAQLALTRESLLPEAVRNRISIMDGTETICLGDALGERYRIYSRPGCSAVEELRAKEKAFLSNDRPDRELRAAWREEVRQRVGWDSLDQNVLLLGQDAAFARGLAERFRTVGGVLEGLRQAVETHCRTARDLNPLTEGSPLAQSHGTRYPIVQGPMARITDTPEFALQVAQAGGLPFVGLALMRGSTLEDLLEEMQRVLGNRPWGVGLIGFLPVDLRRAQLDVLRTHRPPFALIAGGRPDQARPLEEMGIPTYLHVPSPGLLKMFLQGGSKRFVLEGRECGGHVGPLCSFVLWEAMIDTLLEHIGSGDGAEAYHVLFAGGIHDALSAAMISTIAAPLAERGVRVGIQMGTAYLFTQEIVASGALVKTFQQEALECDHTVVLEVGPGHANRCIPTPFSETFEQEKRRLLMEGLSPEEQRRTLEELSIGRLSVATKGFEVIKTSDWDESTANIVEVKEEEQRTRGMYMIGQVGALRERVYSMEELHRDVSIGGTQKLAMLSESPLEILSKEQKAHPEDIAIIGMACILPKAPDVQTYWENILNKVDAITEVPRERWDWRMYYDLDPTARDKSYSKWGGFLDDILFDPTQYGIPPNTLSSIEPLQLLTLEVVRAALEDAGYVDRDFDREHTSVILGAGGGVADLGLSYGFRTILPHFVDGRPGLPIRSGDILSHLEGVLPEWTEDTFAGLLMNVAAGRVANRFDLGGSNYVVDAACASSLAAVHLAVKELRTGSSNMAIVGGIDAMQGPFAYLCFSKTRALSPTGRARVFDEYADGIVLGEGLAFVVLKRLADAEQDGDRTYAVIKGVGASSDGKDKSMTAPRPEGQARALRRAYAEAGFSPATVRLIEAHGTGTVVGDQAEITSLSQVFGEEEMALQSCAIGSVKSMIGHTKCTAGVAGLIKAVLALYHQVLPPTLGVKQPNTKARFSESPFYVNTETRPWLNGDHEHPRRAGVSAFGFGGTNFHVVLEEYTGEYLEDKGTVSFQRWPAELFIWRRASREAILEDITSLEKTLEHGAKPTLQDLAYTLAVLEEERIAAKGDGRVGLAVVATSLDDLRQKLVWARELLVGSQDDHGSDPRGIYFSERALGREGKVAFLFPGQGSQYVNMLRDLALQFSGVRSCFERADRALRQVLLQPLSEYIFPRPTFTEEETKACQEALTQTHVAQPAVGAADLAVFHLLGDLGVRPDVMAGHSYGEYVALCAGGVFGEEVLFTLSEARGRFIVEAAGSEPGTMAAVETDVQMVARVIEGIEGVVIANVNAPAQTVISGMRSGVEETIQRFQAEGIRARFFPVACAFHSPLVAGAKSRLAEFLADVELTAPRVEVFSNTTAGPYPRDPKAIADVLVEHLVHPVEFVREVESMFEAGARIFVEVGPRGILTRLTGQILKDRQHLAVASDQSTRSGLIQLHHLLGQLSVEGVPVRLTRVFQGREVHRLNLDTLEKEIKGESPSTSIWLVNGGRARPLKEAPQRFGRRTSSPVSERATSTATSERPSGALMARLDQKEAVLTPPKAARSEQAVPPSPKTVGHPQVSESIPVPHSEHNVHRVMGQFQQLMKRFLDTQRNVMMTYLQGGAPGVSSSDVQQMQGPVTEESAQPPITQEVQPKAEDFAPSEAKQGVPDERATPSPQSPEEDIQAMPSQEIPAIEEEVILDKETLTARLLQIVSERTGYPQEMLDLDLDLEADLGIDSIKRVEILGSFQEMLVSSERGEEEVDLEELAGLRTLRGIVGWIENRLKREGEEEGTSPALEQPGREGPTGMSVSDVLPKAAQDHSEDGVIKRFILNPVEISSQSPRRGLLKDRVVVLTDDERGVAQDVAQRLRRQGHKVCLVQARETNEILGSDRYAADLSSFDAVALLVDRIRKQEGPIGALVHLLPLKKYGVVFEKIDFGSWNERLQLGAKSLFYLVKVLGEDLREAGRKGGGCVVAATSMGGVFANYRFSANGYLAFPGQGGIPGFLKTLAWEWPEVCVKAIDVPPQESSSTLAAQVLEEMLADDNVVEVGYDDGRRLILQPVAAPLDQERAPTLMIESSWVILVTGGARGITADVARYLAERYRPTLLLVGRSPFPDQEEAAEIVDLTSPQELKAALIARMRAEGRVVKPADVEAAYTRLLRDREMRANVEAMKRAGATVRYYSVDVRDEKVFGSLLDEIYASYGRLDGVIHGAGIIEDKLVRDKTPESFDRVFDTKVKSAFILSRKLRPESLKFLVFFSSVAGRFGNRGQSDYSAANEVVNKLAVYLNERWPGRVVSVNWGPWATTGMVSPELQKQFAQRGVELIPRSVGPRKLDEELRYGRKGEVEVIIGGGGWEQRSRGAEEQGGKGDGEAGIEPSARSRPFRVLPLLNRGLSDLRGSDRSRLKDGCFDMVRTIDPDFDLYLRDHCLDGKPVLPMAMAAELMAEAALASQVALSDGPYFELTALEQLQVLQGIVLDGRLRNVRLIVRPTEASSSDQEVEVRIVDEESVDRVFYRAKARLSRETSLYPYEPLVLIEPRPFPMSVEEAYDQWLFHGPLLQGIERVEGVGSNGIRAILTPSSPRRCLAGTPEGAWLMDPVVVDSALQLIILWARMYWDMTPLPSRFGVYRRFEDLSSPAIGAGVHVRPESKGHVIHADIAFLGEKNRLLGRLEDMEVTCSTSLNRLAEHRMR